MNPSQALGFLLAFLSSSSQPAQPPADPKESSIELVVSAGRPVRVALDARIRVKRVGQPVTATVVEPVYAYDRIVVPTGAKVLGQVEKLEGPSSGTRLKAILGGDFTPPRRVVLRFDRLVLSDGQEIPITTRVGPGTANVVLQSAAGSQKSGIAERAREELANKAKQTALAVKRPGKLRRFKEGLVGSLPFHPQYLAQGTVYDAELLAPLSFGAAQATPRAPAGTPPPPDGILSARLLTTVDSARTPPGTAIHAVLTQPLLSSEDQLILPEGTELTGEVTLAKPARGLHRHGQLRFLFETVQIPEQAPETLLASLYSAEVSRGAHLAIDEEGGATVRDPNTRFLAPMLSAAAVGASFIREPVAEPGQLEAGELAGATEANSLGTAAGGFSGLGVLGIGLSQISRPVALGLGLVGLAGSLYASVLGKGRDVSLPAGTRMQVQLAQSPPAQ